MGPEQHPGDELNGTWPPKENGFHWYIDHTHKDMEYTGFNTTSLPPVV